MLLIAADEIEPNRTSSVRIEEQVDRPRELDPVQAHRQAQQLVSRSLPHPPPSCPDRPDANVSEPLFTQERHETAGNRAQNGRAFGTADDHLEALHPPPPDRHD